VLPHERSRCEKSNRHANGAFSVYSYRLDGKTMTVIAQRDQDGPIISSETIRLTRVD
jgi:hypothetical protein